MVHTAQIAAAVRTQQRRSQSSGSLHAGAPIPSLPSFLLNESRMLRRHSSHRYHTFPTQPPKTPLEPSTLSESSSEDGCQQSPLPVRQLALLALLSLSEQTALNSISPYIYYLVGSFPEIGQKEVGLYVGILASAFALAQLSTNLLWGYLSDKLGRKPILILGTFLLMACFSVFGFCQTYWQVVAVHVAMGMLNGNAAVVPTVLGEVTDRSNQSTAFTWLPVIYSLGGITGPALGGLLVGALGDRYPYLASNLIGAVLLCISVVVMAIWFEETHEDVADLSWSLEGIRKRFQMSREKRGSSSSSSDNETEGLLGAPTPSTSQHNPFFEDAAESPTPESSWRELLNRTTIILLVTYLVFQLANISFNSLYPVFAAAEPPTGRGLEPGTIGLSLSAAGVATIVFQAFLFQPLKSRVGNMGSYRYALLGMAISMGLIPWVGYKDSRPAFGLGTGKVWLYIELGVVLIVKNICAVGGLSSVMLLITNSAPSYASLGTLNGIAQTLSAAGRSVGPFVSGGLFTLTTRIQPKGEAIAWGVFGAIALIGWMGTLAIDGRRLESDDFDPQGDGAEDDDAQPEPEP